MRPLVRHSSGFHTRVAVPTGSQYADSMTDTAPRRPYRTDLTDAQWALIAPTLTAWREERTARGLGINPPTVDLREVFNALIYLDRTGCQWDLLPHDFPP